MSRFQAIENELKSINGTVFQELCDSYLKLKNKNYLAFSRTGSQTGKQKTTKGTPDSFFLLPNGNYLFVEITTDISTKDKLANDIRACFNFKKTKVPINKVEEIVLCINWNIDQKEILKLNTLVKRYNNNVTVRYLMLQELAIELHLNHRDLAHEYLGLPLDTGQIVSMETFIGEYNKASKGISTPLNNTFLHRENEFNQLRQAIHENDFVILTGAPGVGKTKLALEGIKGFLADNLSFGAYCISYKHHTLLDDLFQYFDSEKDYVLFVDDANRIDAFNQITGFYRAIRKGQLKVVITVRDYAFQEIGILCQEFFPKRLDLEKFSDEQVTDIIKADPFNILNPDYHKEIVRIADGNPRLAIMTALLARAEQNIYALHDVSDLFENYFSTFIKDDGEFAKELNIKCLGLIAFFFTIPYKNKEITESILRSFDIVYSDFIDVIDKLDQLELVEIQFEHVKIPEQNLSTYFFYKAFIKDNLLSFEILLNRYFDENSTRFNDCVIPANNTFGSRNVMDKLLPHLQNYWQHIKNDKEKAFKFLSTFWFYLMNESIEFIYSIVASLPDNSNTTYEVAYENNAFSYQKNEVIELLGEFFRFPSEYLKDSLELAFEYSRKKPEHLPELIHKIREKMTFDREDMRHRPTRQNVLFEILISGLNNSDSLLSVAFYELSKTFLKYKFQHTKGGRNHSFYWYHYSIPNSPLIQEFRTNIWNSLEKNWDADPINSFELLKSYSNVTPDVTKEIMEFDILFIVKIIKEKLTPSSFEHCKYVQDQIRWCNRNSVTHISFSSFSSSFTNPMYEDYLKIDWDKFRDKEMFEFDDYREYEKLKEAEIRSNFIFKDFKELEKFYDTFMYLKKVAKNDWQYNTTLDLVVDENCKNDFEIGCQIFSKVISENNETNYIPRVPFRNHLNTKEKVSRIWEIIQGQKGGESGFLMKLLPSRLIDMLGISNPTISHDTQREFNSKRQWELSFYDNLDESLISKDYVDHLIHTISSIKQARTIHFDRLKRFLLIEPNLFQKILETIFDKNEKESTNIQVWMDFFSTHFDQLGDDFELIKQSYIQQNDIQNHFDHEGKGFLNILKQEPNFLFEYVDNLYQDKRLSVSADHRNFAFIWQVDNIEPVLENVFNLVDEKEPYFGIGDHFCNSFFRNLKEEIKNRAKHFLIDYISKYYSDSSKMNIVVDIARNSMNEIFEEVLLLFISLCQDRELFSEIWWRGNGGTYSGDVIIADIEMADWKNIQSIIEKSDVGIKLIPIKTYINEKIEQCNKSGDWERQRRFMSKY
ncbi:ATP-binding protein [Lewinella cohaerens]|uniref:nSTAND3 domain-containing NTPase n=1 Tax=Lewinella cohaerens TaxID=70995 RepID=UPI00036E6A25|nr:ATP-binding protein [Lewinella cohaerens]